LGASTLTEVVIGLQVEHHGVGAVLALNFGCLVVLQLGQDGILGCILVQRIQCSIAFLGALEIVLGSVVPVEPKFLLRDEVLVRWRSVAIVAAVST
jgi:hypothetical protein